MAELTVESGPLRGQTVILKESQACLIGSAEDCTLRVQGPGTAEQHLVIKALKKGGFGAKRIGADFRINGRSTEAARLNDGDVLEVGDTRLRFGPRDQNGQISDDDLSIEGFRLMGVLGNGGHGKVYRAEQLSLHRQVALKVLDKEMTKNPEFVGRFVAEARAAARLSHPNVVHVFDVGHDGDTYYLSMEIMEHGSLEDRLKKDARLPVDECVKQMTDAARGLAYAESMRIVHRDIKPDNLMVDAHEVVKIADLGLALTDDTERGRIVGTPHFMSPEQVLNRTIDHRSDLYSLGCTFFRLVTGRTLFQGRTTKEILTAQVKSEPDAADDVREDVPEAVADIIDKLVEKDPDDRYQSANELIEDLNRVLNPPAKKGMWIAIGAVLLIGAGYAIYWGVTRPDRIIQQVDTQSKEEAAKARAQAREFAADASYAKILLEQVPPLQLAKRLDAFAANPEFKGTKAAGTAIAKAKDLRAKEAKRLAREKARNAKIETACEALQKRVRGHIGKLDLKAAVAALDPQGLPADIRSAETVRTALTALRDEIRGASKAVTDKHKAAIAKGKADRDPGAAEKALDLLAQLIDKNGKNAWPAAAFADHRELMLFVQSTRKELQQLRQKLADSKENAAWASWKKNTLAKGGILDEVRAFHIDAAAKLAGTTAAELRPFQAGGIAKDLLAVVAAARSYVSAYAAAVQGGKIEIPFEVNGAITDVRVRSFASTGDDAGLTVAVPGGSNHRIPLAELGGSRLFDVFVEVGDGKGAAHENRLAFLSLHVIATHLDAAAKYMAAIHPKSANSESRFTLGAADFKVLLRDLARVPAAWQKFLVGELRAARELSRALRAFSLQRYTTAHAYLDTLQKRFRSSLVMRKLD